MKIGHFVQFAPHAAGIYETARDLILAERKVGIDSQMIDYGAGKPENSSRVWCKDGDIETVSPEWALKADILVRHSAIPKRIYEKGIPIVMCLHGAPEYSFLLEHTGKTRTLKELIVSHEILKYKACVTFWKQNIFNWEIMLPGANICYCPPPVDLDKFNPNGKKFKWESKKTGDFNIVITNVWRTEYVTPYSVLFAAAKWVRDKHPSARVHIFGTPKDNKKYPKNDGPVNRTLLALQKADLVGSCFPAVPFLDEVYRAADMIVTPHVLASRTVREAMASGCPIVAATGNPYTPYTAHPKDIDGFVDAIEKCYQDIKHDRQTVHDIIRKIAEKEFNMEQVGKTIKEIFEKILIGEK